MKKIYLIVPCVLVLVFAWFERGARRERAQAEEIRAQERLAVLERVEATRLAQRRKADEDARARALAREEQERRREASRSHDHDRALRSLAEETAQHVSRIMALQRDLAKSDARLAALHAEQRQLEQETFDLARDVETKRIDRRSLELEIQRTTKMVASRLHESEWARGPSSPTPAR